MEFHDVAGKDPRAGVEGAAQNVDQTFSIVPGFGSVVADFAGLEIHDEHFDVERDRAARGVSRSSGLSRSTKDPRGESQEQTDEEEMGSGASGEHAGEAPALLFARLGTAEAKAPGRNGEEVDEARADTEAEQAFAAADGDAEDVEAAGVADGGVGEFVAEGHQRHEEQD